MRLGPIPDGLIERIGLLLGKVPTPVGEALYSMPVARSLQVAQRTGILGALAEGPRDPTELAEHLGLQATGTIRVLDVIATLGHVKQNPDGRYEMTKHGRTWLDPRSDTYIAGAHGEFSMALCRRHEGLKATIVDLPGSARVGQKIVAEAGMSDRVRHVVGDMFEVDYEGHYDAALCFNIIHHLSPEQIRALFQRIRAVLRPGAPLCVLDLYDRPGGQRANLASILGLFFHLTSGADTYTTDEVGRWMGEGGYGSVGLKGFRRLPDLQLLIAKAV
jgi:SAM-dependent methyltransferase